MPPEPHSIGPNPRIEERRAAETASLHRVQRRVGAIGFLSVTLHAVVGLIVVACMREEAGQHAEAVGLAFMSGVVAVIVYVVTRIVLGGHLWSPAWIVLALTPSVVAIAWVLS